MYLFETMNLKEIRYNRSPLYLFAQHVLLVLRSDYDDDDAGSPLSFIPYIVISTELPFTVASFTILLLAESN